MLSVIDLSSVLLFTMTLLALYVVYRSRSNRKYPPSMPWLPIVGSLPFMKTFTPRWCMEKSANLGNVFSYYVGSKYVVVVNGGEAIREALVAKSADFAGRQMRFVYKHYKLRESPGIVQRPYDSDFKRIHKQTLSILKDFGFGKRIMESRIAVEISHLIDFITDIKGEAFDFYDIVMVSFFNVIHALAFGSRRDFDDSKLKHLLQLIDGHVNTAVLEIEIFPILRFLPRYHRRVMKNVSINREINNIIQSWVSEALVSESVEENFIRSFMKSGGDRLELPGLVLDLILAGSATIGSPILWGLVLLANHPEIQDRLHKEIDAVVPGDRSPTLDDRSHLPYFEAVMLEILRYKSPIPHSIPRVTCCDTELAGYFIPKGTQIEVNLYSVLMDPMVWKDPDDFRPERFLDDDGNITRKDSFIPFSLGKRACMGEQLACQELFLFLTAVLQQFAIRPPVGEKCIDTSENLTFVMFPSRFKVRFISRKR